MINCKNVKWFVVLLMGFVLGLGALSSSSSYAQDNGVESLRNTSKAFASVAKQVSPAVVFVQVEKSVAEPDKSYAMPFDDELFRHFFGTPFPYQRRHPVPKRHPRAVAQGSGFIIDHDGYIITNNHVVEGADKITVKLQDDREFTAEVIGTDKRADVALIKIDADNLAVLSMGDSDKLQVGEWVIAVGNPFGLSHTITAGIVSAKGRNSVGINDYEDFIQTDAAINPGNSGGPLVNLDGEVVGMNTAIFSKSGGYMGIGFAIPVNMVKSIEQQLKKTGSVVRGYLGVMIQQLTPELAKKFGMSTDNGVLVGQVTNDSAAQDAGLKRGDVVVSFDGKPVHDVGTFRNRVALVVPGITTDITVMRDGRKTKLDITIGSLPDGQMSAGGTGLNLEKLGFKVQNIDPDTAKKYGYAAAKGVMVTKVRPGSVASMAGIRSGTLIMEVNRQPVGTVRELQKAIGDEKGAALLLISDGRGSRYVVLKVD